MNETLSAFRYAIQNHLDETAQSRQYDSILTAISYRDCSNPQYAAEGQALHAWRSAVWTYATTELEKVVAGLRPVPTVESFIAELPPVSWPD